MYQPVTDATNIMTGKFHPRITSLTSTLIMDKRVKSEQFRKRKKNYFERAYEIGITCETGIFVLFERNGKIYTFTNMDELPTQEEIVSNWSQRKLL